MADLFDVPVIPGLVYRERFITPGEELELIEQCRALGLEPFRFHGWTGKRLTRSFGWRYDFERASFLPTDPIPDWLMWLRERAADLAGLQSDELPHALIVRYDPGAGIGWHRDRPQFDRVVGTSLASPVTMRFRQRSGSRFRRVKVPLAPGSAYLLSGEVRSDWEHGIESHDALRYSITFRSLSELGRRVSGA